MLTTTQPITVHIDAGVLNDALKRTKPAICKKETRYYLRGVFMHFSDRTLHFVATDGYRMSIVNVPMKDDLTSMPGVILPPSFVAEVIKATNKPSRAMYDCPLVVGHGKVSAHPYQHFEITCEPIEGTFPDYMCIIPRDEAPACGIHVFKREELLTAVAALTGFQEAAFDRSPALLFSFEGHELKISAKIDPIYGATDTWESNHAAITLKLTEPISSSRQVGFNGRYLVDALKTFERDSLIAWWFFDPARPSVFKGVGTDQWLIMPMRV